MASSGARPGTEPGYAYSESLKGSGITWTPPTLDKWIADPDAVIPGNAMSPPYSGMTDPEIRKKIVAYLKTISPQAGKRLTAPRPAHHGGFPGRNRTKQTAAGMPAAA